MPDIKTFLGLDFTPVSHRERLLSLVGGFLGIAAIMAVTGLFVDPLAAPLIVASMGASAVLVFAVPHGPLSQPWAVFGGHMISAVIGVTVGMWLKNPMWAGALAVGLAIGVMHYLRCIHPPGGATALSAVVSGPLVLDMGYQYVLTPVLINVLVILLVAFLVNVPFPYRRYPVALAKRKVSHTSVEKKAFSHDDIRYALRSLDLLVDVGEAELSEIFNLATSHARGERMSPLEIQAGHYYSNGEFGEAWQIRHVVDQGGEGADSRVIYKIVAGHDRLKTEVATLNCFARWARFEVVQDESNWRKVTDPENISPD